MTNLKDLKIFQNKGLKIYYKQKAFFETINYVPVQQEMYEQTLSLL